MRLAIFLIGICSVCMHCSGVKGALLSLPSKRLQAEVKLGPSL